MKGTLTVDVVIRGLAEELAASLGGKLGGAATNALGEFAPDAGWLASADLRGGVQGRVTAWFGTESAQALARQALKTEAPASDAVAGWLRDLVSRAFAALAARPQFDGIDQSPVNIAAGTAPSGAQAFELLVDDKPVGVLVLHALLAASAAALAIGDARLEAVLDVDLPLVVRFGRAIMPLRALAELAPGSVVDMGRSPDEPVDLLVGERIIARGEVVIVAGNYGVRITELMNGAGQLTDMEART